MENDMKKKEIIDEAFVKQGENFVKVIAENVWDIHILKGAAEELKREIAQLR